MNYDRFVMTINGEEHWAIDDLARVKGDALNAIGRGGGDITVKVRRDSPQVEPMTFFIDGGTDLGFRPL